MHRKILTHKPIPQNIAQLVERFNYQPELVLEILRDLHSENDLTSESTSQVARALHIPPSQAYGFLTFYSMLTTPLNTIRVCDGPACWLGGAAYVKAGLSAEGKSARISRTSCLGLCDRAPALIIDEEQCGPVELEQLPHLETGWRGKMPDYSYARPGETRILLAHSDEIDPDSIESALSFGAYQALGKALSFSPEHVINEIEASGLRGRGGAGFPTGRKLRFVAQSQSFPKYIICNADESEPLVFKDRVLIDTNPHKILEGIALAAYASGANQGFIYIRGEYKRQAERLEHAIAEAENYGWLGKNIQNSDFSCTIHVHRGAGAYICGEETALIESLEGKRGEPRIRPPFPATFGYHGKPTLVNNVETFAYLPEIIQHGSTWYRNVGSKTTPGTKLYTILGHVNRPGLVEAPYGLTLRQIITEFGEGMRPGSEFYFALTGGAAGTFVPKELMDIPIDYSSVNSGVSLGAGAFLICDQSVSPIFLLREVMVFFESESCGKCTPCRIGTQRVRTLLDRIISNKHGNEELKEITSLADLLQNTSFCGLGQSASIPIKTALSFFSNDLLEK